MKWSKRCAQEKNPSVLIDWRGMADNPRVLVWETCWRPKAAQTPIHHPLTPLQDSHSTWISSCSPCMFGTKYDPCGGLVELMKGLSTTVIIAVKDLFRVKGSLDTHPSPSDTLTRLALHLNQFWLTLQVWDQIWPWWPWLMSEKAVNHSYYWCERLAPWSHSTCISSCSPCTQVWDQIWPWWPTSWVNERAVNHSYWRERLVEGQR